MFWIYAMVLCDAQWLTEVIYSYPKHVWSPAGGWYSQPANWKANTAVMGAVVAGVVALAWGYSAEHEFRNEMPRVRLSRNIQLGGGMAPKSQRNAAIDVATVKEQSLILLPARPIFPIAILEQADHRA